MTRLAVTALGWTGKYKWRLDADYVIYVNIDDLCILGANKYIKLDNRKLTIYRGYCWDGASGPTWDTPSCRRGSLVHDALYQLMREGKLSMKYKLVADSLLHKLLLEDGMWKWRADAWLWAVTTFGKYHMRPRHGT